MASGATNDIGRTLAINIRAARLAAGLTQHELAVRLELGSGMMSVSAWERDINRPSDSNLEALARVLDHPVAWFYTDHEAAA